MPTTVPMRHIATLSGIALSILLPQLFMRNEENYEYIEVVEEEETPTDIKESTENDLEED